MTRLSGKHVAVTGASSGIGRAIAIAFGAEGATVWLGARREDELARVAEEIRRAGGVGHAVRLDVTDPASVDAFADAIARGTTGIDVLVNGAGVGTHKPMEKTSIDTWNRVIATNLTGPFLVTKATLPLLRAREGRRHVVNIVSVASRLAFASGGTYAASKFGLRGWTEAVAAELAPEGIRVTAVHPGFVATPMVSGVAPAERMIQPDELARVVVDLTFIPESIHVDDITLWPWRMYTD